MRNPNEKRSRRFTSEKNAKDFANTVKGELKDLRNEANSKSNFKVTYTKENARIGMNKLNDF